MNNPRQYLSPGVIRFRLAKTTGDRDQFVKLLADSEFQDQRDRKTRGV